VIEPVSVSLEGSYNEELSILSNVAELDAGEEIEEDILSVIEEN